MITWTQWAISGLLHRVNWPPATEKEWKSAHSIKIIATWGFSPMRYALLDANGVIYAIAHCYEGHPDKGEQQ